MATGFLGEIRMGGFNFAPRGWALCNGQIMSIAQNTALFSLLGTNYGGNGQTTFALPNLQGRVPIHWGTSASSGQQYVIGEVSGTETVQLLGSNLPAHSHLVGVVGGGGNQASPINNYPAVESTGTSLNFSSTPATGVMNPSVIQNTGSNIPFSVMQPFLCVTFIIALQGIFPSRN